MLNITRMILIAAAPFALAACSGGGSLSLESNARKIAFKGSPFVTLNQGGKALIVEQGKTAATGVHGWVAVQSVAQRNLTSPNGTSVILNSAKSPNQNGVGRE